MYALLHLKTDLPDGSLAHLDFSDCWAPLVTGAGGGVSWVWTDPSRRRMTPSVPSRSCCQSVSASSRPGPAPGSRWPGPPDRGCVGRRGQSTEAGSCLASSAQRPRGRGTRGPRPASSPATLAPAEDCGMKGAAPRDDCYPSPLRRNNNAAVLSPGPGPGTACGNPWGRARLCTGGCWGPAGQGGSSEMGCQGWTGRHPWVLPWLKYHPRTKACSAWWGFNMSLRSILERCEFDFERRLSWELVFHVMNVIWFLRDQVRAGLNVYTGTWVWPDKRQGRGESWRGLGRLQADSYRFVSDIFRSEICHWWMTVDDEVSDVGCLLVTRLTHWGQEATQTRSRLSAVLPLSPDTGLRLRLRCCPRARPALVPGRHQLGPHPRRRHRQPRSTGDCLVVAQGKYNI